MSVMKQAVFGAAPHDIQVPVYLQRADKKNWLLRTVTGNGALCRTYTEGTRRFAKNIGQSVTDYCV